MQKFYSIGYRNLPPCAWGCVSHQLKSLADHQTFEQGFTWPIFILKNRHDLIRKFRSYTGRCLNQHDQGLLTTLLIALMNGAQNVSTNLGILASFVESALSISVSILINLLGTLIYCIFILNTTGSAYKWPMFCCPITQSFHETHL